MLPPTTIDTFPLIPSCLKRSSTLARASSIGMPTLSLILVGAAPVPPLKPSMAIISAPLLAIPEAIAATLCTAAILTITGFLYSVASFKENTSCLRSSIEYIS